MGRPLNNEIKILILLLTTSVTITAKAQLFKSIHKYEGIIGAAATTFASEGRSYADFKKGYSIGFGVGFTLTEKASANLRFLVERKGTMDFFENTNYQYNQVWYKGTITEIYNLDYLSLPLTLEYPGKSLKKGLAVECGLYISYLRKASSITIYPIPSGSKKLDEIGVSLNPIDYGIVLGVGYSFNLMSDLSIKFWTNATYGVGTVARHYVNGFFLAGNQSFVFGITLTMFRKPQSNRNSMP